MAVPEPTTTVSRMRRIGVAFAVLALSGCGGNAEALTGKVASSPPESSAVGGEGTIGRLASGAARRITSTSIAALAATTSSTTTTEAVPKAVGESPAKVVPTTTLGSAEALRGRRPTTTLAPAPAAPTTTAPPPVALPVPTGTLVQVTDHGATPNDDTDDQAAIQDAIDSAPAGATVVFAPGTYKHSATLNVRTAGVTLWGYGATLVATNADNHALMLRAANTGIRGFTLLATPNGRKETAEQMGITLVFTNGSDVRDNVVRGTSAAGIFIWGSSNFRVANNVVENTMADGIHNTGGSNHGVIEGNRLRNVGDDCFAVVSYITDQSVGNNITIRNNSCVGGKARGVSVVGGNDIVIANNTIESSAAAAVYLASEANYNTYADKRVQVIGNTLRNVNTNPAIYHGAIFLWARSGSATTSDGSTLSLQNEDILIRANTIVGTIVGDADIVAQGNDSIRVNILANTLRGEKQATALGLSGSRYNLVGNVNNDVAVADHVGDPSILP